MLQILPLLFGSLLGSQAAPTSSDVKDRLQLVNPKVDEICAACGVAGASIGVINHGKLIHTYNHGFSNVQKQQPITSDTVFCTGSLTKSFVAAGLGKLVYEKFLSWDTPVRDIFPEFRQDNKKVEEMLTVSDILSHRSGLSGIGDMSLAFQGDGDMLFHKDRLFSLFKTFPTLTPFRSGWDYFVWGYSLAGEVIEKLSGKRLGDFLSDSFFKPLNLQSTTFKPDELEPGQLAEPYAGLSNGDCFHLPKRQVFQDTFFEASGGLYSSLNDMMSWSNTMLQAIQDESYPHDCIIREVQSIISNHIAIENPSLRERSYGYGWLRTQLPGVIGLIGDNSDLWDIKDSPVLGTKDQPLLMLYHQGSTVGYYSFIALFPDTNSAVVVLTNSIGISDAADWISRAVIQALFELKDGQDYVALAKEANRRTIAKYELLSLEISAFRESCTQAPPTDLNPYFGTYTNDNKQFSIDIIPHSKFTDRLALRFQGLEDQTYELRYYCDNVFEWSLTHDESKKRGRYNNAELSTYLFKFNVDDRGMSLSWANDPVFPERELVFIRDNSHFVKEDVTQSQKGFNPGEL
ncbi:hypothetical protein G7Z17_g4165 [Cylindrodendrum hubeiense]|uniref:Beta-lactamase-related domain-containing protein n=1 Tax=Cylindrodendrum hubeiense TaxID=595255 RepID=A0A9P5H9C8_9HYPO|nr:hypothetical protein G7Z17_g4165 [Cylindrodendrum hubeiense]